MGNLRTAVAAVLHSNPGLSARELASELRRNGHDVRKRDLNPILYGDPAFVSDGSYRPLWSLNPTTAFSSAPAADPPLPRVARSGTAVELRVLPERRAPAPQAAPSLQAVAGEPVPFPADFGDLSVRDLHAWQEESLRAWYRSGCRGVVEAVTGTGKTHVGLAAIGAQVASGGSAVVLVPGVELLAQWQDKLAKHLPSARVALLGDGNVPATGSSVDVTVAVVHTAARDEAEHLTRSASLVVADECHRYGAEMFARALRPTYRRRLGLTATYERNDDGVERVLNPFFGGVVYTYDYERAVPDGVVAPFRVALLGVSLSRPERVKYDGLSDELDQLTIKLRRAVDPRQPYLEQISRLAQGQWRDPITKAARAYLKGRQERLVLLAECDAKRKVVEQLAPLVSTARTLVFTEQKQAAEDAAQRLRKAGVTAEALHSGVVRHSRRNVLSDFGTGKLQVVCAPRVLDEGVDVPEADLGVVLASTKTKRQMIQRMGRVLRRKHDGRHAQFVLVFADDTFEDPDSGAHEGFLDMVVSVAQAVERFPGGTSIQRVGGFLRGLPAQPSSVTREAPVASVAPAVPAPAPVPLGIAPVPAPVARAGRHAGRTSTDPVEPTPPPARPGRHARRTPPAAAPPEQPRATAGGRHRRPSPPVTPITTTPSDPRTYSATPPAPKLLVPSSGSVSLVEAEPQERWRAVDLLLRSGATQPTGARCGACGGAVSVTGQCGCS